MIRRSHGLWRQPNFMRLWAGQTISLLGSQIGDGALRYTAILVLAASPAQASALAAARLLPVLLLGLLAGVLVDRLRRRSLMIAADIGRGLLLLVIPLAYALGLLRMELLYLIAALVGGLTIVFDAAYEAFLPQLVEPAALVEGNSKLGLSRSLAEIGGPPLGGLLVQLLSAPLALVIDALSFFGSALALGRISAAEPRAAPAERQPPIWRAGREGLIVAWRSPVLRALLGVEMTFGLAGGIIGSLYDLYLIDVLKLSPALVGITIGAGGISALLGALLAERVVRRYGLGATLASALLLSSAASTLIPLAHGPAPLALLFIVLAQLTDGALAIYAINAISLRQATTPAELRGRVGASFQLLGTLMSLVGIGLGGLLGQSIGLRGALAVSVCIGALSALWIICSPVRRLKEMQA